MSRTKVIPLESGVLYSFEDEAVNYDETGRVISPKKTKPVRPARKKPTTRRPRKHNRRA